MTVAVDALGETDTGLESRFNLAIELLLSIGGEDVRLTDWFNAVKTVIVPDHEGGGFGKFVLVP